MGLLRWTIICNLASVLALYLFVAVHEVGSHIAVLGSLLIGLAFGRPLWALLRGA